AGERLDRRPRAGDRGARRGPRRRPRLPLRQRPHGRRLRAPAGRARAPEGADPRRPLRAHRGDGRQRDRGMRTAARAADPAVVPERLQDRMYHDDPWIPRDVVEVRERAREVCMRDLAPLAPAIAAGDEVEDGFPWAAFRALGAAGLYAIPFPAPLGPGLEHPAMAT